MEFLCKRGNASGKLLILVRIAFTIITKHGGASMHRRDDRHLVSDADRDVATRHRPGCDCGCDCGHARVTMRVQQSTAPHVAVANPHHPDPHRSCRPYLYYQHRHCRVAASVMMLVERWDGVARAKGEGGQTVLQQAERAMVWAATEKVRVQMRARQQQAHANRKTKAKAEAKATAKAEERRRVVRSCRR